MLKEYYTVLNSSFEEYEEKKSRFLASVKPVETEEEAVEFINSLKTKYWDARHNVYAYFVGIDNVVQRFSDDGEPSGTAGMPTLEVIKRMEVQNLVVVITRYFGGTLLGAAGLIRAYSKSAAMGIEAAQIVKKILCVQMSVVIEYSLFGKIQSLLISEGFTIKNVVYEQDVEIIVYVPVDRVDSFVVLIEEATSANALVEQGDKVYITLDKDGKLL